MKFLITNMTGFKNKGCEATTKAIVNEIRNLEKNARFKCFTRDPEYDALWMKKNTKVSFITEPFRGWYFKGYRFGSGYWQSRLISKLGISTSIRKGMNAFRWGDAILSTGGDIFSSTYGDLQKQLTYIQVALKFKKPVILVGHSIGPFEKKRECEAFAKTMRHVQLITVRESLSYEYLRSINLKNTKIELTTDPAFCLEPDTKIINDIWKIYNIPHEKTIVGIAPSQAICHYTKVSYTDHLKMLIKLIQFLTGELGCHVVLIPHVQESRVKNNDRIICDMLYRKLGFPKNVSLISLIHSAEEIRAIVARLDILIAERMHAAIASLSQNVPTFVIGYSVKTKGILGDILGFNNLEDYMIPITKLTEETLKERVKSLWDQRSKVARYLSEVTPHVKENAKRNFTLIMDVLRQLGYEKLQ